MSTSALIAVVDDDESVRESLPDLLKTFGYDAAPFDCAEAFLASDLADRADGLLLDIVMPGMNGPELSRKLKRLGYDIPTIFMTAHADDATAGQLREEGASDVLFKPFDPERLVDALRIALREPG